MVRHGPKPTKTWKKNQNTTKRAYSKMWIYTKSSRHKTIARSVWPVCACYCLVYLQKPKNDGIYGCHASGIHKHERLYWKWSVENYAISIISEERNFHILPSILLFWFYVSDLIIFSKRKHILHSISGRWIESATFSALTKIRSQTSVHLPRGRTVFPAWNCLGRAPIQDRNFRDVRISRAVDPKATRKSELSVQRALVQTSWFWATHFFVCEPTLLTRAFCMHPGNSKDYKLEYRSVSVSRWV